MRLVLFLIAGTIAYFSPAQSVMIDNLTVDGETVSFDATIQPEHSERERYNLQIYSSLDDFQQPIGYVFEDMKPGQAYSISFNGEEQFGKYQGELEMWFEVVASSFPIKINTSPNATFKQGKNMNLSWADHHGAGSYDIELYQNGTMVQTLAQNVSGVSYAGVFPETVSKGSGYEVVVKPNSGNGLSSESLPVIVKAPAGLFLKLSPLIAAGIAAPIFLLGDDSKPKGIEDPPGPPDGN